MIIKPYWERIEMCATANIAQLEFLFKEKHSLLQKKVQRHSAKVKPLLVYFTFNTFDWDYFYHLTFLI